MAATDETLPFVYSYPLSAFTQHGGLLRHRIGSAHSSKTPLFAVTRPPAACEESPTGSRGTPDVSASQEAFSCATTPVVQPFSLPSSVFRSPVPMCCSSSTLAFTLCSPHSSTVTCSPSRPVGPSFALGCTAAGAGSLSTSPKVSPTFAAVKVAPSSANAASSSISAAASLRLPKDPAASSGASAIACPSTTQISVPHEEATAIHCSLANISALPPAMNFLPPSLSAEENSFQKLGRTTAVTAAVGAMDVDAQQRCTSDDGGGTTSAATRDGAATEAVRGTEEDGVDQHQRQSSNFYEVLGVPPHASANEIRRVYYALCRVYHPDKCASASSVCAAKLHALQQAYGVLGDEIKRIVYDIQLGMYSDAERQKRVAELCRLQRERTRRDVESMREEYKCKVKQELKVNGLLIRKALYGNLALRRQLRAQKYVGPVTETCLEGPFFDVTVPLQCQIENSRFVFSGGCSGGTDSSLDQLRGFHNPALCTGNQDNVCLYVLYYFRGIIHETTTSHQCPLMMPLKRHRIFLASRSNGPYAPSNVTSIYCAGESVPHPLNHAAREVPPPEAVDVARDCSFVIDENTVGAVPSSLPCTSATNVGEATCSVRRVYVWSLGDRYTDYTGKDEGGDRLLALVAQHCAMLYGS